MLHHFSHQGGRRKGIFQKQLEFRLVKCCFIHITPPQFSMPRWSVFSHQFWMAGRVGFQDLKFLACWYAMVCYGMWYGHWGECLQAQRIGFHHICLFGLQNPPFMIPLLVISGFIRYLHQFIKLALTVTEVLSPHQRYLYRYIIPPRFLQCSLSSWVGKDSRVVSAKLSCKIFGRKSWCFNE